MLVDTCDSTLSFATNQDLMVSKLTFTNILGKKKQKTSLPLIFQDTPNSKRHLSPQFHGVGPTLAESVGTHTPGLASRLQEIDSEMALFSDSHSVAPSARACQEVRLPELEPGPVYTNSSEKYGCIIIEAVSFNVASLLWKPLHAWSATMRSGRWNSDWRWREHLRFEGAKGKKELLDGIEWAPRKANKHESQGGDRDCCGCPTHKYTV